MANQFKRINMKVLLIVIVILIIWGIHYCGYNLQKKACEEFAASKNCTIVSTDTHITAIGTPFYFINKNGLIWEIRLDNNQTWFMRPGILGENEWEQLKNDTK